MSTALTRFETALTNAGCSRGYNGSWTCPAHDDNTPSLSVTLAQPSGKVLVYCHAKCETAAVLEKLGLGSDALNPDRVTPTWAADGHTTGIYTYYDESGQPLYVVHRGEGKKFRQSLPDGTPGLGDVRRVLFNLPAVLTQIAVGGTVDLCEGEKDVLALYHSGAVATCNSGGSAGWKDVLADSLTGAAHVRVWRDRDEPGTKWARLVTASLAKREIHYSVVEAAEGKDAWDHLAAGYGLDEAVTADLSAEDTADNGGVKRHQTGDVSKDGRVKVIVSSHGESADWLRTQLGTGPLSGIFERDGRLVRVPRIGEHGYEQPAEGPDAGPARVDQLSINQVRAMLDVRYDCGANKESTATDGSKRYGWENKLFPKPSVESAVTGAEMGEGAPSVHRLTGITHTPAVRPDWSVLDTPGYDAGTGLLYLPDPSLGPVTVPDAPSADQIKRARDLMLEPVAEFPFVGEDHRANWCGAMLTPLLRRVLPPPYPMLVVTATNRGSGKGFLAGMLRKVHGGVLRAEMPRDSEEMRKQITALLLNSTAPVITWDNLTGVVRSPVLEALLTTDEHSDRELGANRNVVLSNDRLWTATGNNASFGGDLDRRTLAVALDPPGPDQHKRTDFRLKPMEWIVSERAAYLGALLTLVRGWHLDGAPLAQTRSDDYGDWSAAVSGILQWAEVPGTFGGGSDSVRDEDTADWADFLRAVYRVMGGAPFLVRELVARIGNPGVSPGLAPEELPGDLADLFARSVHSKGGFIRSLGKWFRNRDGRYSDGWKSEMIPDKRNGNKHRVCPPGDSSLKMSDSPVIVASVGEGSVGVGGEPEGLEKILSPESGVVPTAAPVSGGAACLPLIPHSHRVGYTDIVTLREPLGFDLETADADKLYTGGHEGPFVRLSGVIGTDADETVIEANDGSTPLTVTDRLTRAESVYGHNILGFDLQALARHEGAPYMELTAGAVDTLVLARLTDPPGAKGMKPWSVRGYYGLDAVAARMELPGKTADLKALVKEHGGYDRIPMDDERYTEYLRGDLTATRAVYERFVADGALTPYALREMKVVALQNLMTVNGCRVDTRLLGERVDGEALRRREAVGQLAAEYGLPVTDGAGRPSAKPWTTKLGKAAIVAAFEREGAPYVPRTATGAPKLGKDSLGSGTWMDHTGEARPGVLAVYGHLPGVRRIVDLLLLASGAADKYAEITKYLTDGGRVHPKVGASQASGRWAYIEPSLTNVGKRGHALEQREVIVPEPGHVILTFDFDQVDMRGVAGHSRDTEYAKLFEPGRDAHSEIADTVFGRHDGEWRENSKAIGHGWNYGRGVKAISESRGLPLDMVQAFDQTMRDRFPRLSEWKREVADLGSSGALLDNGFGRLMRCDPQRAYTQAPALMGQGSARDIMCEGLLRLPSELWPMLRLVVHDEIVMSVPEADQEDVRRMVLDAFTMEFKGVPVTAGASQPGKNWRAAYGK